MVVLVRRAALHAHKYIAELITSQECFKSSVDPEDDAMGILGVVRTKNSFFAGVGQRRFRCTAVTFAGRRRS